MSCVTALHEESGRQDRLFFILSGEHDSLPPAEVRAIIESEGIDYRSQIENYRLLSLIADHRALRLVSQRSLMYDQCGMLLAESNAELQEIERLVRNQPLEDLTKNSETSQSSTDFHSRAKSRQKKSLDAPGMDFRLPI